MVSTMPQTPWQGQCTEDKLSCVTTTCNPSVCSSFEDQPSTASPSEAASPPSPAASSSAASQAEEVHSPIQVPAEFAPQALAQFVEPQDSDAELAHGLAMAVTSMAMRAGNRGRMTCFHAVRVPGVSIRDYVCRIRSLFGCSGSCFPVALVFVDRLIKSHPGIIVSQLSSHRLLLIAIMLAAKVHDDTFYSNAYYAKVGGLTKKEMNMLEARFCTLLKWKLYVDPHEFAIARTLCKTAAQATAAAGTPAQPMAPIAAQATPQAAPKPSAPKAANTADDDRPMGGTHVQ